MNKKSLTFALVTLLLVCALSSTFNIKRVSASTIVVPDDYTTIQEAIDAANTGDTIFVKRGIYNENLVEYGAMPFNVEIIGEDQSNTILNGTITFYYVSVSVSSLTIEGGLRISGDLGPAVVHLFDSYLKGDVQLCIQSSVVENNIFEGNLSLFDNRITGIESRFNIIRNNTFYNSGIALLGHGNLVTENKIFNCPVGINETGYCYDVHSVNENAIVGNRIEGCDIGIESVIVPHNDDPSIPRLTNITKNTLDSNAVGIRLQNAIGMGVWQNNFINNIVQAVCFLSYDNVWDDGYPNGGNYWADYADIDIYSGIDQNEAGRDAIWDHPYSIDESNMDHYPLTVPFSEWDMELTASVGVYSDLSTIGVREDATLGFDMEYDEVDAPAPPEGVVSYLFSSNNPSSPVDLRFMQKSLIPRFDNLTWLYKVKPVGVSGQTTLSWSSDDVESISDVYSVLLLDSNGLKLADMRETEEYSFSATADVTYNFVIRVFAGKTLNLHLNAGWNMVSFPVLPADNSVSGVFSGIGFYQIVTWSGTSYVTPSTVEAGRGYWVLVLSETTLNIVDLPVQAYELDLPAGWTMIGSVYEKALDAGEVFSGFYQLVTWGGTSYHSATTIESGKGYWALVLEPTHISVS